MQVTFEFDLDLYMIDRDVYSILDWIGDIGGLSQGLAIIFAYLIGLVKFNEFQHFMIENLYRKKDEKPLESPSIDPSLMKDKNTRLCR